MSELSLIRMDYQKALNDAQKLDDMAKRLKNASTRSLGDSINLLVRNWSGANAKKFVSVEEQFQRDVASTISELHKIASDIRSIAKSVYDAEMAAYKIASERKS